MDEDSLRKIMGILAGGLAGGKVGKDTTENHRVAGGIGGAFVGGTAGLFAAEIVNALQQIANKSGNSETSIGSLTSKQRQDGDYDCDAYRCRDMGLYSLVVAGDIDNAMRLFADMEQRTPNPGFGLAITLRNAYVKAEEDKRASQLIRQVVTDDVLNKIGSVVKGGIMDLVRLERERYNRRNGGPRLSSADIQMIETSIGKERVQALLNSPD